MLMRASCLTCPRAAPDVLLECFVVAFGLAEPLLLVPLGLGQNGVVVAAEALVQGTEQPGACNPGPGEVGPPAGGVQAQVMHQPVHGRPHAAVTSCVSVTS